KSHVEGSEPGFPGRQKRELVPGRILLFGPFAHEANLVIKYPERRELVRRKVDKVLSRLLRFIVADQDHPAGAFQIRVSGRRGAALRENLDPLTGVSQVAVDTVCNAQAIRKKSEVECHLPMDRSSRNFDILVPLPRLRQLAEGKGENDAEDDDSHLPGESPP